MRVKNYTFTSEPEQEVSLRAYIGCWNAVFILRISTSNVFSRDLVQMIQEKGSRRSSGTFSRLPYTNVFR